MRNSTFVLTQKTQNTIFEYLHVKTFTFTVRHEPITTRSVTADLRSHCFLIGPIRSRSRFQSLTMAFTALSKVTNLPPILSFLFRCNHSNFYKSNIANMPKINSSIRPFFETFEMSTLNTFFDAIKIHDCQTSGGGRHLD